MRTLWDGIVSFIRESIIMVYVAGATLLFSFLYLFVFIQHRCFTKKTQG